MSVSDLREVLIHISLKSILIRREPSDAIPSDRICDLLVLIHPLNLIGTEMINVFSQLSELKTDILNRTRQRIQFGNDPIDVGKIGQIRV